MYGFLISLSILVSLVSAEKLIKKDEKNTEILWGLALIVTVAGVTGARIYHVIDYWSYYSQNLLNVFYIWNGGLGIYGAIIAGSFAAMLYLKHKKQDIWYYLSILTIFLPLGQAIGRWGNYFNKEVYGSITTLPWGIYINGTKHHPLFLYESLGNFLLFSALVWLKIRGKLLPKRLIGIYLAGYGTLRFLLEFLKENAWRVHRLNVAQLISIIFLSFSYILISQKETA